jgi:hypothetical protein
MGFQPFRVGRHPIHIHAFALELLADEPAHMLVAYSRDQTRLQPEPGRPAGDIRRRTADIFVERPHVFEPSTNLRTIQINARASDGVMTSRVFIPCTTITEQKNETLR